MMIDDLVTWLRAQLDEDERIARAASPAPWTAEPYVYGPPEDGWGGPTDWEVRGPNGSGVVTHQPYEGGGADEPDARHIAHHDPIRVLAEVAAKRALIDWALTWLERDVAPWNSMALRIMALPYADRLGFREEWWP